MVIACHILSHHLLERAISRSTSESKEFLWLGSLFFEFFFSEFLNVWLRKNSMFMRLPFSIMKLRECLSTFEQNLCTICSKNLESVIYLQSLIENGGENIPSTSTPCNSGCTWGLGLLYSTDLFFLIKTPEVHFSLGDVSKTTDHQRVSEWTNSDRVSESLSKLESWLTINVVHSCSGWLLSRNNNEFLSGRSPNYVLDLIVKDRNEMSILSLVDPHILKRVLTIVTLARRVIEILRPNENSVSRWGRKHLDILSFGTSNIELGSLECTIEVINVHKTIVFKLRQDFSVLPCHEVVRRVGRALILRGHWAE